MDPTAHNASTARAQKHGNQHRKIEFQLLEQRAERLSRLEGRGTLGTSTEGQEEDPVQCSPQLKTQLSQRFSQA